MGATDLATKESARPLTDDPVVEAEPVRGILLGLLLAALFWILVAGLVLMQF